MTEQDLSGIARAAWKKRGTTPAELFGRLTPSQFVGLFAKKEGGGLDRVEELTRHNDERGRKGLRPVIPAWLIEGDQCR